MASVVTPRVLPGHLHAFAPSAHPTTSTVRLLGIITTVAGDQATLTCGSESVTIILNRDSHVSVNSMYEVVGKVIDLAGGQGLGIRVLSTTEWPRNSQGELANLKIYEAVVDATHRYKTIFYGSSEDSTDNGTDGNSMFFAE